MNYIKNNNKIFCFNLSHFIFTILCFAFFTLEAHAGLEKAKGILSTIQKDILSIVPIIAVIALICLGIGYAINSVQKDTFMRWGGGLIIVGSAAKITDMLLG